MGLFKKKKKEEKVGVKVEGLETQTPGISAETSAIQELRLPEIKLPELKLPETELPETKLPETKEVKEIPTIGIPPGIPTEFRPPQVPLVSRETVRPVFGLEEKKEGEELIKGPIFVKITKYRALLEAIEKISKQISSLENDLGKLNETRKKEEEEINRVVEEIENIKEKISTIQSNLFSKLE